MIGVLKINEIKQQQCCCLTNGSDESGSYSRYCIKLKRTRLTEGRI